MAKILTDEEFDATLKDNPNWKKVPKGTSAKELVDMMIDEVDLEEEEEILVAQITVHLNSYGGEQSRVYRMVPVELVPGAIYIQEIDRTIHSSYKGVDSSLIPHYVYETFLPKEVRLSEMIEIFTQKGWEFV